jgi:hypothetical protein
MIQEHFFIIGAQRCGTTYLYNILDSHPEICMAKPVRPEPKYFFDDMEFKKGKEYYQNKYFSSCNSQIKIKGEKCTSYIEYPFIAQRIKQYYKNAKIIILLRNPVERAISNYYFSYENKLESRTIEDVFLNNKPSPILKKATSVSPFDYLERGNYLKYLPHFMMEFENNIQIILFEDLFSSTQIYKDIYDFLNVNNRFVSPHINSKVNHSVVREKNEINPEIYKTLKTYYKAQNMQLEVYLDKKLNWNND